MTPFCLKLFCIENKPKFINIVCVISYEPRKEKWENKRKDEKLRRVRRRLAEVR